MSRHMRKVVPSIRHLITQRGKTGEMQTHRACISSGLSGSVVYILLANLEEFFDGPVADAIGCGPSDFGHGLCGDGFVDAAPLAAHVG